VLHVIQNRGMSYVEGDAQREAYRNTIVTIDVDGDTLVIDPLEAPYVLPWVEPVYVITAWNPGMTLDEEENRRRNDELRAVLDDLGHDVIDAVGRSRDGRWAEPSFAIIGLDRDAALDLGRRFGQVAIFELTTKSLEVLDC
jgi:hypothetical protein